MSGTRDFLAEAFETVGQNLLASETPQQTPTAAATPTQTQEPGDQPPHAEGTDPPAEDDPDAWLLVTGATPAGTPTTLAAAPAALFPDTDPPAPPAPAPGNTTLTGTLHAAVLRRTTRGTSNDVSHRREWAWQKDVNGASARAKAFKEQALAGSLRLFAFMQPGNHNVNVFHSAGVYFDPTRGDEAAPKTIAFVGDRSPGQGCIPVALKPEKPWSWPTVSFSCDEDEFTVFTNDNANKNAWYQPEGLKTTRQLPIVLFVPTLVAPFLSTIQRTPGELYSEVQRLIAAEDNPIGQEEAELVKLWAMAAAQSTDGSKSILSMDLEPVLSFDPNFTEWMQARLNGTLGALPPIEPTQQPPPAARPTDRTALDSISLRTAETLKAVVEALNKSATTTGAGATSSAAAGTKHIYTTYELAALQGFCGVTEARGIPKIWLTFQTARKADEVRANLKEGMQAFARERNCELDGGVFFEKKTLDDIVDLKFNPGGGTAVLKSAGLGLSILACRPISAAEREHSIQREEALQESKGNRTLEEAFKASTTDPRYPPSTYHELRLLTATYAGLLAVLFGPRCDHFQKVWNLYNIMKNEAVEEKRHDFTATLCRQIVWAILDDSRGFFNQRLHPDRFTLPIEQIPFPTSLLDAIYPNVRWQEPIHRSIPSQWMTQGLAHDSRWASGYPHQHWGYAGVPAGLTAAHYSPLQPFGQGLPPPPASYGTAQPPPPPMERPQQAGGSSAKSTTSHSDKLEHVHPVLRGHLSHYHSRFRGSMRFGKVLKAANVTWDELPKLPGYTDDRGKNQLCFNHICGRCTFRPCRLRKGHVPKEKIPDAWAEGLWKQIEPGIRYTLQATAPSSESESPGKKQKM